MNLPAFFALALLAFAPAMPGQCLVSFPEDDSSGPFRDLTIAQLVDAAELLEHHGWQLPSPRRPDFAPDFEDPDALLFFDLAPLAPREAPRAALPEVVDPGPVLPPSDEAAMPARTAPPPPATGAVVVTCSAGDPETTLAGGPLTATEAPPVAPIPEPSAIVLLLGAAAWILLRRKH